MRRCFLTPVFLALMLYCSTGRASLVFDWATVSYPGNPSDPATGNRFGAVDYIYKIGKHEVTNAQYVAFLNAKARNDAYGLYHVSMGTSAQGGIIRSSSSDGYTYSLKSGMAQKPVVFVPWNNVARFVNWLHNGQGDGDTETGVYDMSNPYSSRSANATYVIPTEDEWYKAAYYQPSSTGGDSDGYWYYPTAKNAEPNSDQPPGASIIAANAANFYRDDGNKTNGYNDGFAVTGWHGYNSSQVYLTNVGAYTKSPSYFGTFDQGGNVYEWNETLISDIYRGVRGGSWASDSIELRSHYRSFHLNVEAHVSHFVGFRIAYVPEPGSLFVIFGVCGTAALRRRR